MISEGWMIRGKLPGKDGIEQARRGKRIFSPVGGYTAYTKVQRQNTAWLQHHKDGMQRKRPSLQTAFSVGSLVLMGGRLFTCLSKAVSRVEPGKEGISGDQPWSHSSAPTQCLFQISLNDVLLRVLLRNDGKSAQQRENPAKPKPLCPRAVPRARASR